MEPLDDDPHNLSPLELRRAKLRAWTDEVLDAIQAIDLPKTYLEGERALRCSAVADRVLNQLFGQNSNKGQTITVTTPHSANRDLTHKPKPKSGRCVLPQNPRLPHHPRHSPPLRR